MPPAKSDKPSNHPSKGDELTFSQSLIPLSGMPAHQATAASPDTADRGDEKWKITKASFLSLKSPAANSYVRPARCSWRSKAGIQSRKGRLVQSRFFIHRVAALRMFSEVASRTIGIHHHLFLCKICGRSANFPPQLASASSQGPTHKAWELGGTEERDQSQLRHASFLSMMKAFLVVPSKAAYSFPFLR